MNGLIGQGMHSSLKMVSTSLLASAETPARI